MSRKFNALLGLGALAFASSAFAQCPSSPVPPWSATNVGGGASAIAITSPGYDGTQCKMTSALGNSGAARAQVRDDTPSNEPRYRAQFLFDPAALSGAGGSNQAVIFIANAENPVSGNLAIVRVVYAGSGGGTKRLLFVAACGAGLCQAPVDLPVQGGPNRVEFDLTVGASGTLRYWVTAPGTATNDGSPTGTVAITGGNAAFVGVNQAFLGLTSPSAAYRNVNTGAIAGFDEFDSRRQTFIGN